MEGDNIKPDIVINSPKRRGSIPFVACALKSTPAISRSCIDSALKTSTLYENNEKRLRGIKSKVELPNRAIICNNTIDRTESNPQLNEFQIVHILTNNAIFKKGSLLVLGIKADSRKFRILCLTSPHNEEPCR